MIYYGKDVKSGKYYRKQYYSYKLTDDIEKATPFKNTASLLNSMRQRLSRNDDVRMVIEVHVPTPVQTIILKKEYGKWKRKS
jgi:hypothetical protein